MTTETSQIEDAQGRSGADWLAHLAHLSEDSGYLEPVGARHWAHFADEGPALLVCFDTLSDLAARPVGDLPPAQALARDRGWSSLTLIADGPSWYRDTRVWRYFDRLIDEGFFEDFDRVLFHGAGMGGYAACAFSVAAPGSSVLALRPVASLSPLVAGWDGRHRAARALDFTSRFGFAPDMIAGAARVFLIHDPSIAEDAMHAALFRHPVVARLDCRHLGPAPEAGLAAMDLLPPVLEAAMEGRLTPALWSRLWRARRDHLPWVRAVAAKLAAGPHRGREAAFLRAASARFPDAGRFQRRLEALANPAPLR